MSGRAGFINTTESHPSRWLQWLTGCALSVMLLLTAVAALPPFSIAANETDQDQPKVNPYAARQGLSTEQLARFLERMQDKPVSVRGRPGFAEAVVDAADRLLEEASDEQRVAAVLAKFQALHFMSVRGNEAADEQMARLAEKYGDDPREAIAEEARFCLLERRALKATELEPDQLSALLEELKTYFTAQTSLGNRHLRLASTTVKIINSLEDGDAAGQAYKEFGKLFAASDDRALAKYGKRIARGVKPATLVGKPLEIAGVTPDGTVLDWGVYRDKIVLVDFWATWCGPCRAELPNVKAAYERFHDQGFEIVGISLDTDREQLEQFLVDEGIEWVNLFGEEEAIGWKHPMAVRLGVRGIPATFLLDRQGKVIAQNLRGEQLTEKLEELFESTEDS